MIALSERREKERRKGLPYLRRAISLESTDAMLAMARMHLAGDLVAQDTTAAIQLLTQSAELGNDEARCELARLLLENTDVTLDVAFVRRQLQLAQGSSEEADSLLQQVEEHYFPHDRTLPIEPSGGWPSMSGQLEEA